MPASRSTMDAPTGAGLTGGMETAPAPAALAPSPSRRTTVDVTTAVLLGATLCTGLMAGLFYAYSVSVMPGLSGAADRTVVETMQRINVAILNGWFGVVFGGALVLTAAGAQLVLTALLGSIYPTVGASGGVFGLLLAFGMMFPNRTIVLLIPPMPMKAKVFVAISGGREMFLCLTGRPAGRATAPPPGRLLGGCRVAS